MLRRASQLIITSVKESRHANLRSAAKDVQRYQINTFLTPIYAENFRSISDNGGSSAPLPATAAAASGTKGDSGLSTSDSPSIDIQHRYSHILCIFQ